MAKIFDFRKYALKSCLDCNGTGVIDNPSEGNVDHVCSTCGGFGVVKRGRSSQRQNEQRVIKVMKVLEGKD